MAVRRGFLAGEKRAAKNVDNVDKPKRAPGRKDARKKKRRFFLHFRPKYEKMEGWRKEKKPGARGKAASAPPPGGDYPHKFPGFPRLSTAWTPPKPRLFKGFG